MWEKKIGISSAWQVPTKEETERNRRSHFATWKIFHTRLRICGQCLGGHVFTHTYSVSFSLFLALNTDLDCHLYIKSGAKIIRDTQMWAKVARLIGRNVCKVSYKLHSFIVPLVCQEARWRESQGLGGYHTTLESCRRHPLNWGRHGPSPPTGWVPSKVDASPAYI